jgi:hypothetical protein
MPTLVHSAWWGIDGDVVETLEGLENLEVLEMLEILEVLEIPRVSIASFSMQTRGNSSWSRLHECARLLLPLRSPR